MTDFVAFPLEVKTLIFGYLTFPEWTETRNVCKDFYKIITGLMHNTLEIPEDIDIGKLSAFLSPDNEYLSKVRHIRIRCSKIYPPKDQRNINNVLAMLTNTLPRNILLSVRIDTGARKSVDYTILNALHKRQTRLRTVRCLGSVPWCIPDFIDFSVLSSVQLFIEAEHHLSRARAMLVAATQLQSLEVCVDQSTYLKIKYRDTHVAEASADIINKLLGEAEGEREGKAEDEALQESDAVLSRALSTLRIRGLDLSVASQRIFKAIRPSALRSLAFQDCQNECSLLQLLARASADDEESLRIRHLQIVKTPDLIESPDDYDDSIDEFLDCFDTLETLLISAPDRYTVGANASSISNHDSLRTLYLEYGVGVDAWYYPESDLYDLFDICKKIEQLALNFPDMSYLPDCGPDGDELPSYLDVLDRLPKLSTLRVLNLPGLETLDDEISGHDMQVKYAGYRTNDFARTIFEHVQLGELTVVSLGKQSSTSGRRGLSSGFFADTIQDDFYDLENDLENKTIDQMTYFEGTLTCPSREETYMEILEVRRREARKEEPLSDILEIRVNDPAMAFVGYALE